MNACCQEAVTAYRASLDQGQPAEVVEALAMAKCVHTEIETGCEWCALEVLAAKLSRLEAEMGRMVLRLQVTSKACGDAFIRRTKELRKAEAALAAITKERDQQKQAIISATATIQALTHAMENR